VTATSIVTRCCGAKAFTLPIRTRNPCNGSQGVTRGGMFARQRERTRQRNIVRMIVGSAGPYVLPVIVTIARVAPSRGLDPHDGLGASLKGVIDGVADGLGLSDDRDPRVKWRLEQRRGPYAVEVRIASSSAQIGVAGAA